MEANTKGSCSSSSLTWVQKKAADRKGCKAQWAKMCILVYAAYECELLGQVWTSVATVDADSLILR